MSTTSNACNNIQSTQNIAIVGQPSRGCILRCTRGKRLVMLGVLRTRKKGFRTSAQATFYPAHCYTPTKTLVHAAVKLHMTSQMQLDELVMTYKNRLKKKRRHWNNSWKHFKQRQRKVKLIKQWSNKRPIISLDHIRYDWLPTGIIGWPEITPQG